MNSLDQRGVVELLRAKRQLDHDINISVCQWMDQQLTDQNFISNLQRSGQNFMDRMAPFMDKEPTNDKQG